MKVQLYCHVQMPLLVLPGVPVILLSVPPVNRVRHASFISEDVIGLFRVASNV
jgi:hypothetical protein